MKRSLKHAFCLFALLTFAIGCGKDGGGGSNNNNYGMNPIINPGSNIDQNALNNLRAWYSSAETQTIGNRGEFVKQNESVSTGGGFQFSWCFFGQGPGCTQAPQASNCYVRNGVGYDIGTPTTSGTLPCSVTQSAVTKGSNVELQKAVNGNGLTLLEIRQSGTQYTLIYGQQYYPQAAYVIDTSLHSIFNPIVTQYPGQNLVFKGYRILNY